MTTKVSINTFLEMLTRSGLLDAKVVEPYRSIPAERLAYQMIEDGVLTEFQARQLVTGRFRGFFVGDKYKILDLLGRGGMGRVLLCEHLMLQRLVAVKLMYRSRESKPGATERFLQEARAAAKFDHPNLARVFDVDNSASGPYIVMEFIDGINLHELVAKHGRLSPERSAHYISQSAMGLQQAHLAGLVHRDIKPGNLMLDRHGTVKLLDLGLARFFDNSPNQGLTSAFNPNAVLGTADFIAPEQALDSSKADIRADIYSLGCTFYFLLLRTLPVGDGTTMQKLLRHQSKEPESIRVLRPDVPEEMVQIVERMMKKDPVARYQTPIEVVEALAAFTGNKIAPPSNEEMPPTRLARFRPGLSASPSSRNLAEVAKVTSAMSAPQAGTDVDQYGLPPGSNANLLMSNSKLEVLENPEDISQGDGPFSQSSQASHGGTKKKRKSTARNGSKSKDVAGDDLSEGKSILDIEMPPSMAMAPTSTMMSANGAASQAPDSKLSPRVDFAQLISNLTTLHKIGIGAIASVLFLTCFLVVTSWLNTPPNHTDAIVNVAALQRSAPPPSNTIANKTGANSASQNIPPTPPPPIVKAPVVPAVPAVPSVTLKGGGSTFVKLVMGQWSKEYEKTSSRRVEYVPSGSSKGVEGMLSRFLDFGCSDAPLTDKQIAEAGVRVLHVPLVMGAVVPTYNVQDAKGEPLSLRFNGPLLAAIYLGKVVNWSDPAIAVNNPGITLPDLPITVVARKDGSGTTNIWTDYLSKVSAAWKAQVGVTSKPDKWPVGIQADKNDGIADAVSRTAGAIGYVELSYAIQNDLPIGAVKNRQGNFIIASVETITNAAAESMKDIPADFRYSLTDAPGVNSYPIVGTSWAMVCVDLPEEKRREVIEFLKWATGPGQKYAPTLHYGALPAEFGQKIREMLSSNAR